MPDKKKQQKQQKQKETERILPSPRLKVALGAFFVLAFLIASMALLSHLRDSLRPTPAVAIDDTRLLLEYSEREVEAALERSGLPVLELKGGGRFEIEGPFPPADVVSDLRLRLTALSDEIEVFREGGRLLVSWRTSTLFDLEFRAAAATVTAGSAARVAIIMDDMGRDLRSARELFDTGIPVTVAVMPETANAAGVATLAHRHGREVMIHIPMEPVSYPVIDPGPEALLVNLSEKEIRRRLRSYLKKVPYAVGGNNHMGSRFTQDGKKMEIVIEEMARAGFFFVDSRTIASSVAFETARRGGVPAAARDVFLDNTEDVEAISRQIVKLVATARKQGQAVGICHPYPETMEALRRCRTILQAEGIEVVPVAELLVH